MIYADTSLGLPVIVLALAVIVLALYLAAVVVGRGFRRGNRRGA